MKKRCLFLFALLLLFGFHAPAKVSVADQLPANGYGPNLLGNPGFEQMSNGVPASWAAKDNWLSGAVTTSSAAARTGEAGLQIEMTATTDYWVRQTVDVEPGGLYELSAWLKTDVPTSMFRGRAVMKVEFYHDTLDVAGYLGQEAGGGYYESLEDWAFMNMYVDIPDNANRMQVYLRLYGPGLAQFDDASVRKVPHLPGLHIDTDRVFYYPEIEEGWISGTIGLDDGIEPGMTVDVTLASAQGGAPILAQVGLPATPELAIAFNTEAMVLQEPYVVQVRVKSAADEVVLQDETTIYRWARPTSMREDGVMMVDGAPFFPVIGYHVMGYAVPIEDYPQVRKVVNTLQGNNTNPDTATIALQLNQALAHDLRVVVPLYPNVWDLQGPKGYAYVEEVVTAFKDHPAVIGWMIQDEPSKFADAGHPTILADFEEIYRMIRSIDPVHPTYTVINHPSGFDTFGRLTDIVVTDPYPLQRDPITMVRNHVQEAKALNPEKPVWNVLQAFWQPGGNTRYPYLPTTTELRNMTYQSLIEGAQGLGYYSFIDPDWNLMASDRYAGIVQFSERELPHFEQLVLHGEVLSTDRDASAMWRLWALDDQLYVAVANVSEEVLTVTVPLPGSQYEAEVITKDQARHHLYAPALTLALDGLDTQLIRLIPAQSSASLQALVEDLADADAFSDESTVTALLGRLTDIADLETQGDTAGVLLQLESFMQLLVTQYESAQMNEQTYRTIREQADAFQDRTAESLLQLLPSWQQATWTAGDIIPLQVDMSNRGEQSLEEVTVTIHWPSSWGQAPVIMPGLPLAVGGSSQLEAQLALPLAVEPGRYEVRIEVQFNYGGATAQFSKTRVLEVRPIVAPLDHLAMIAANAPGVYPFSYTLHNQAAHEVEVQITANWPAGLTGITLDYPEIAVIAAGEQLTINGHVSINANAAEQLVTGELSLSIDQVQVDTLRLHVDYTNNLLVNPGFEQAELGRASGWEPNIPWTAGEVAATSAMVRTGEYALHLNRSVASGDVRVKQLVNVTGGESYDLSAWLHHTGSGNGRAQMKVEFYRDVTGSAGFQGQAQSAEYRMTTGWEPISMQFEVPENANIASVLLRLYGPGTAYYDDVTMRSVVREEEEETVELQLSLDGGQLPVSAGEAGQLLVTLPGLEGERVRVDAAAHYSSTDPTVADVLADGVVVYKTAGTTVIGATYGPYAAQPLTIEVVGVPAAQGEPSKPILTDDSGHRNGLSDGDYAVTMNMWWGNNGSIYRLYENDRLIHTQLLSDLSPASQAVTVVMSGQGNGEYRYHAELINAHGVTASDPLLVIVKDAAPGIPQVFHDNWDKDGDYSVTMQMWWGTNATLYRLYENDRLIDEQRLSGVSPGAQTARTSIGGQPPGIYTYRVELANASGVTRSDEMQITVEP